MSPHSAGRWRRSPHKGKEPAPPPIYPGMSTTAASMPAEGSTSTAVVHESASVAEEMAEATPSVDFLSEHAEGEGASPAQRTALTWLQREEMKGTSLRLSSSSESTRASRRPSWAWVGQRYSCNDLGQTSSDLATAQLEDDKPENLRV